MGTIELPVKSRARKQLGEEIVLVETRIYGNEIVKRHEGIVRDKRTCQRLLELRKHRWVVRDVRSQQFLLCCRISALVGPFNGDQIVLCIEVRNDVLQRCGIFRAERIPNLDCDRFGHLTYGNRGLFLATCSPQRCYNEDQHNDNEYLFHFSPSCWCRLPAIRIHPV